jgi:hypothetical protein
VRLALAALLVATVACNGDPGGEATRPCDGVATRTPDPSLAMEVPPGLPEVEPYELQEQGSTDRYNAYAPGRDVVAVRDAIRAEYERTGYAIQGSDEEPPAEAEFQWTKGDREGSVRVTPVCEGRVHVRYRVGPR